MVKEVRYI